MGFTSTKQRGLFQVFQIPELLILAKISLRIGRASRRVARFQRNAARRGRRKQERSLRTTLRTNVTTFVRAYQAIKSKSNLGDYWKIPFAACMSVSDRAEGFMPIPSLPFGGSPKYGCELRTNAIQSAVRIIVAITDGDPRILYGNVDLTTEVTQKCAMSMRGRRRKRHKSVQAQRFQHEKLWCTSPSPRALDQFESVRTWSGGWVVPSSGANSLPMCGSEFCECCAE